jgi:hypothetical protein
MGAAFADSVVFLPLKSKAYHYRVQSRFDPVPHNELTAFQNIMTLLFP